MTDGSAKADLVEGSAVMDTPWEIHYRVGRGSWKSQGHSCSDAEGDQNGGFEMISSCL